MYGGLGAGRARMGTGGTSPGAPLANPLKQMARKRAKA